MILSAKISKTIENTYHVVKWWVVLKSFMGCDWVVVLQCYFCYGRKINPDYRFLHNAYNIGLNPPPGRQPGGYG